MNRLWRTNVALALSCALAAIALSSSLKGEDGVHAIARDPVSAPRVDIVTLERKPLSLFAEIAARPLFSPTRRPPPTAPAERTVRTAAPPPDILLTGLFRSGDEARAIIAKGGAAPEIVSLGEDLGGWRLVEITESEVALESGGRRLVASLEADRSPQTTASGPGPARPARAEVEAGADDETASNQRERRRARRVARFGFNPNADDMSETID